MNGSAVLGAAFAPADQRRVITLAAMPVGHDIDPYRDAEDGVDELAWLYADGLVGWDGGIVPLLAQALPAVSRDGRSYRYRLRDVTWHDGRPLRAADVAEAFARVRASPWGTRDPYARVQGDVEVTGERDFVVRLGAPYRPFAESFFGPLGTPALPLIRHDGGSLPLGTGPFAVRRRAELGRWTLERWSGSPRGTSQVDAIELRLLSDQTTANVQLLSGEADIALPLAPNVLGADRFVRFRRVTSTAVLLMNTQGVLRSVARRRAFAAVADVPALQRAYDRRRDSVLATVMLDGPDDPGLRAALEFRPESSRGVREIAADRELVLTYIAGAPAHERTMTLLQQTLAQAGIRSELRPAPLARYLTLDGPLRAGSFDVALYRFAYERGSQAAADWSCDLRPPRGGNFARWCDPAFDRAVRAGRDDVALRRLDEALPFVPLSHAYEDVGFARRVLGFTPPSARVPVTYSCFRWSLGS